MSFFENIEDIAGKEIIGLTDELKALFVLENMKKESTVVVCSTLYEANLFYQNLSKYSKNILFFPMDDFITSEALAISPEFKTIRLETIFALIKNNNKIVVTNLMGYLRFLPSLEMLQKNTITFSLQKEINLDDLTIQLLKLGYEKVEIVNKTGDFSIRGYILDVFPINEENPIRIEFFGDIIEKIKKFNVNTQRSLSEIGSIELFPNTEFVVDEIVEEKKQKNILKYIILKNISLLRGSTVFFNDYNGIKNHYENLQMEICEYNKSIESKEKYMFTLDEIINKKEIYFQAFDNQKSENSLVYKSAEVLNFPKKIDEIKTFLQKKKQKHTVVICFKDNDLRKKFKSEIEDSVLTSKENIFEFQVNLIVEQLNQGFYFGKYLYLGEKELFCKEQGNHNYNSKFKIGTKIHSINNLEIGDFVVHYMYGIGQYLGMKTLRKGDLVKDYIFIKYKGNDKLYIPVEKIDLIYKYSSSEGTTPALNSLSNSEWENTKRKAKQQIEIITKELLELYTKRETVEGFSFEKDNYLQLDFENSFVYKETEDQVKVTREIKKDMESIHPMDRLLCGDVGYGKTEVAFRAIFKAVLSGKQVAFLCPTTILSYQHYQNALERFKNFPVKIALLNRFINQKTAKKTIEALQKGELDLIIGTHKILSDEVKYKDLGLLVIDEEQRFGVMQKENIKKYKNSIDVLTISATPIPRTLQMSLAGVRNLSLIETPPNDRYPIQTYVLEENYQVIKDAINKEILRKGQVFILHNEIKNLEEEKQKIQKLVPHARIALAHGRLEKESLEKIMIQFINKEYDVLVCTTIIEAGIDIPNTNTLIIKNSDKFGLSQLYQIRGRVGRTNKIAYCYLMYKKEKILSEIAKKRLSAIKEFTELGSGFAIAMRDLSIRGAGNILGNSQSGFVNSIGINLFMDMLKEEITKVKKDEEETSLIEVDTHIEDKVFNGNELKIEIHKKINSIKNESDFESVKEELEDRFGKIHEKVIIYMLEALFEAKAKAVGLKNIRQTKENIEILIRKEELNKIILKDLYVYALNITTNFKFKMIGNNLQIRLNLYNLKKHFIYYLLELVKIFDVNMC